MRVKIFIPAIAALVVMAACNKSISDRTANLPALNPADEDINAGTWKPMLLSRPDTFAVAAPAATNSTGYAADINELKGYQKNMTDAQLAAIKYWSAGGVMRWN
jgi:hypothetical protein